jgi:hypothetical protein
MWTGLKSSRIKYRSGRITVWPTHRTHLIQIIIQNKTKCLCVRLKHFNAWTWRRRSQLSHVGAWLKHDRIQSSSEKSATSMKHTLSQTRWPETKDGSSSTAPLMYQGNNTRIIASHCLGRRCILVRPGDATEINKWGGRGDRKECPKVNLIP